MANDAYSMQASELLELHEQIKAIHARDAHLGAVLHAFLYHLGHAHKLDVAEEEAKVNAQQQQEETQPRQQTVSASSNKKEGMNNGN